jgi:hypothetical protein
MPKLTDAQRRILAHIGTEWVTESTIANAAGTTRNICPTLGALEKAGVVERRTFGGSDGGPCRAPEWRRLPAAYDMETGATAGADLTDTQRATLDSIGSEWTPVADIARPNIARTLDSLERAGLIEQSKAHLATVSNGRAWYVRRKGPTSAESQAIDSMAARVRNRPEPEPESDDAAPAPKPARDESAPESYSGEAFKAAPAPAINPADVSGFREWWNDYLSPGRFADDKGMSEREAVALIERGRAAHDYMAPLARALKALNPDVVLAAGELTTSGGPVGLLYRPAGFRPAGSRPIYRESTFATRWVVNGTPYGQEYPGGPAGAYLAAHDYCKRAADVWAPGDKAARTFAGIGYGRLAWVEHAPDTRPGMDTREARGVEPGETGRPAFLIIGQRPDAGLLVALAFEGESVSRVDIRPDEYRPTMAPRLIARDNPGA